MIWPDSIDEHVDADEARLVTEHINAFVKAYQRLVAVISTGLLIVN